MYSQQLLIYVCSMPKICYKRLQNANV